MTKLFKDPPPLFRSLGADNAKSQARAKMAARDAEERWPLFKALTPARPADVPPMDDVDKRNWERAGGAEQSAPRRPLSVPDMSENMARGLGRMGMPRAPLPPVRTPEPATPAHASVATAVPAQSAMPAAASLAAPGLPVQRMTAEAKRDTPPTSAPRKNMFAHLTPPSVATVEDAAPAQTVQAERSLSAIFARLERAQAVPETPAPVSAPRAGFLGRLRPK